MAAAKVDAETFRTLVVGVDGFEEYGRVGRAERGVGGVGEG